MAQLEVRSGDLEGNTRDIISVIDENKQSVFTTTVGLRSGTVRRKQAINVPKYKFILFPELAVSGYNCGALFEDAEFISECFEKVKEIATHVGDEVVIVGAPRFGLPKRKKNGNLKLHNAAYVLHRGEIIGVYDKIHLANDFQHEDRKYFLPGEKLLMLNRQGLNFGVLICEDIWRDDHTRDLVAEMKLNNPGLEAVFCLNYSYFTYEKQEFREKLIQGQAKDNEVAIAYLNALGIGDIVKNVIVYDGNSFVYNAKGEKTGSLAAFGAEIKGISLSTPEAITELEYKVLPKDKDYAWVDKYSQIWEALLYTTRKVWDASHIKNAFVAVSGGVDSAVVGTLAAKALGPERCVFVSMPSKYNGAVTKGAAQHLADKLGVPLKWTAISEATTAVLKQMDALGPEPLDVYQSDDLPSANRAVNGTVDATMRSVIGLSLCHYYKAGILATGNHTENILGWCTFHDIGSIGVFQPIGDLTKTELFNLCEFLNWKYGDEIIIEGLWNGQIKPMAELADSTEDPFDYYLMSGICAELIRHRKTPKQLVDGFANKNLSQDYFPPFKQPNSNEWTLIYDAYDKATFAANVKDAWRRSKISVFKSAQHAPCLILSPRSRGFSSRETIFNYYTPNEGLE